MWTTEFGGTSRIVRVMGSHAANKGTSTELLTFESAYTQTDALAIAPYFGGYLGTPARQTQVASMSVWGLLQELQNTAVPQAIGWMNHSRQVAQQSGVDLIAYEGGQHLSGTGGVQNNQTINNLFDAVNRHPGMKQLYIDYLDAWSDHGDLFVHFTDCSPQGKFGRWGAVEYGNQPRAQAPKYDALLTFIETTDAWW
jgi:hypothetical protein